MSITKLENIEAIAFLIIIMANKIILNLPKSIIASTGTSAWLNTIYIFIIAVAITILVVRLFKKFPGQDILDISGYLGGKFLKSIIGIVFIGLFLVFLILTVRNFSETLKIIYFNESPIIFILLFFIISACIANKFGLKIITKTNLILAPIVIISILLILFSSPTDFVIQRLLPIFGYGINETFLSGLSNLFAFSGVGYLFFLQPLLKNEKSFKQISIISLTISSILLFLSVACLLMALPFILDTNESVSLYLLTRIVNYGEILQGTTTIFILIWILSIITYITIQLFFILYITKKLTKIENTNAINYCFGSIILGTSVLIENYAQFTSFVENILKYTTLIFIYVINISILILANLKKQILTKKANTT